MGIPRTYQQNSALIGAFLGAVEGGLPGLGPYPLQLALYQIHRVASVDEKLCQFFETFLKGLGFTDNGKQTESQAEWEVLVNMRWVIGRC